MKRFAIAALFAAALSTTTATASAPSVPLSLQAELTVRVAAHDKRLPARAATGVVRIAVYTSPCDAESRAIANAFVAALRDVPTVAGLPHEDEVAFYESATALASRVNARHTSIAYLTPSLSSEVPAIARALDGMSVLTVAATADDVPRGAVLGFELVGGKTKLLVNLGQAKKQDVQLPANVLKLATVYP